MQPHNPVRLEGAPQATAPLTASGDNEHEKTRRSKETAPGLLNLAPPIESCTEGYLRAKYSIKARETPAGDLPTPQRTTVFLSARKVQMAPTMTSPSFNSRN